MEKNQYDLCIEILRRLNKAGVLKDLIIIGSRYSLFYIQSPRGDFLAHHHIQSRTSPYVHA